MSYIEVQGARTHNLKNIDVRLPHGKLIVITGPSGSGKSSLAFDTLYAEGQRRYVESLSAYARQFLSMMEKPDVDNIQGLSPAISIEQKTTSHNPRSTVGTVTEIYDYLRLLFARVGTPHCPEHKTPLLAQTITQMITQILSYPADTRFSILAPIVRNQKGEHRDKLENLKKQGFLRVRINGTLYELDHTPTIDPKKKNTIEVVVDRMKVNPEMQGRLADSLATTLKLTQGLALVVLQTEPEEKNILFSSQYACTECGFSLPELQPRLFSFNNPLGACPECDGLGVQMRFDPEKVVHQPQMGLAGGAIRGWDKRNPYYFQYLEALAEHYNFSLDTPFEELSARIQNKILHGTGKDKIAVKFLVSKGKVQVKHQVFEGVLPNLLHRYEQTHSELIQTEMSQFLSQKLCNVCNGERLNAAARHVKVGQHALSSWTKAGVGELLHTLSNLKFQGQKAPIAEKILKEICQRLNFLVEVGLDYLTLDRGAQTLSGGEAQRIRLASQIGSGLQGVMYVLDEPSIGLHQRDNSRLLRSLCQLRDLGNTIIVVEHDEEAMQTADYLLDIGPGAGVHGGQIVAQGTPEEVTNNPDSLTGMYLSGKRKIPVPQKRVPIDPNKCIKIRGASEHNLKNVNVDIPVGLMTCITGVSGSGKSTLINHTLYPYVYEKFTRTHIETTGAVESIEGLEYFDKVVNIDQDPIGRTPRSNAATYTGMFTEIRDLFAELPESKARGYKSGRFSFNVADGRCLACEGDGLVKVEMHFLADIYVPCEVCNSKRYNDETLQIYYKGKNIHDVLSMTVEEAREFFDAIPPLSRKLQTLLDVGLGYLTLGQSATTLSGGEAQRVKLSKELSKRDSGNTLYILDEPTTGLHFQDVAQLLQVLHLLRDKGNTIIVIEHNLDVIKTADWIIDLGPEGGAKGGNILFAGTPEALIKCKASHTGQYLHQLL